MEHSNTDTILTTTSSGCSRATRYEFLNSTSYTHSVSRMPMKESNPIDTLVLQRRLPPLPLLPLLPLSPVSRLRAEDSLTLTKASVEPPGRTGISELVPLFVLGISCLGVQEA